MKNFAFLVLSCFFYFGLNAQSPIGAWETFHTSEEGEKIRTVVVFSEGYQVATNYNAKSGAFIDTNGGSWSLEGKTMTEIVEFDTRNPDNVGNTVSFEIQISEEELSIVGHEMKLKRIDNGNPGKLEGAWLMSGMVRDGKTQTRDTNRPRKTMKILSGTRFQWIAYNTETKQFMGTGGGTYTTIDGKYTENIEFFSRDNSRAGASLKFNFEMIDGSWHHKGFSSKGDSMHEIWSKRQ